MLDILIVSDFHLGSPACRADDLLNVLKRLRYSKLILLGDIFTDLNFERLPEAHWKVLRYLRTKAEKIQVIWVYGNHDAGLLTLGQVFGFEVLERYEFYSGSRRVLALHGHQFDPVVKYNWVKFFSWIHLHLQYGVFRRVFGDLDTCFDRFHGLGDRVRRKALKYAADSGYDIVICGHTHEAYESEAYYNSGCWTGPGSWVMVRNGTITLEWNEN